jgi:hypothetical protein
MSADLPEWLPTWLGELLLDLARFLQSNKELFITRYPNFKLLA